MCTGQYTEMQNLLHEQTESLQSINIVEEFTYILDQALDKKYFTIEKLKFYIQIMETVTEACVGNVKNCKTILDGNILPVINTILQLEISDTLQQQGTILASHESDERSMQISNQSIQISHKEVMQLLRYKLLLKVAAVELLEVMAEKNSSKKAVIIHQIYEGLDINALHRSMVTFSSLRKDQNVISMELDDNSERALFSAYNVCMYIVDSGIGSKDEFGK